MPPRNKQKYQMGFFSVVRFVFFISVEGVTVNLVEHPLSVPQYPTNNTILQIIANNTDNTESAE